MEAKDLSKNVSEFFKRSQIDPDKFIAIVKGDFDKDYNYCNVYVAFNKENLYILRGHSSVSVGKRGRLFRVFEPNSLQTIKIEAIDKLIVERNLGTSRLCVLYNDKSAEALMVFSLSLSQYFEQFCKILRFVKEGNESGLNAEKVLHEQTCPKCGKRYPDQSRHVCPDCMSSSNIFQRLMSLTKGYTLTILMVLLGVCAVGGIAILWTYFSNNFLYDQVLDELGDYYKKLVLLVIILIGIRVIEALFRIVYSTLVAKASAKIVYDLKMRVFSSMQKLGLSFFSNKQTGDLMTRINDDTNSIYWFLIDIIPYFVMSVLEIVAAIAILFSIHFQVGIIVLAAVPLYMITLRLFFVAEERLYKKNYINTAIESAYVNDSINGQRIIKTFSKEQEENSRFKKLENRTNTNEKRIRKLELTEYPIANQIFKLSQVLAIFFGAILMLNGQISKGAAISITSFTLLIFDPLDFLAFMPSFFARTVDAASRIFEVSEATSDCAPPLNPVPIDSFKGDIRLDNVSFNYDLQRPVIKNLSLEVPSGQMLGIAGKSGAGKTTMINLIARLYDVKSGAVYIDGVNVVDIDPQVLRKNIGIVSQESYLFAATIADNIRYADKNASLEDVIKAAKAANAHDFIMRMPDGYETIVGEGGQDLSGGEKQRVSIARTILQNPKILILDEATAAMDTKTERAIQLSLNKLKEGRTTIAIAHRLSTLRDADKLCVIDSGELKEYGTHQELLDKRGIYFELFKIQAEALKFLTIE